MFRKSFTSLVILVSILLMMSCSRHETNNIGVTPETLAESSTLNDIMEDGKLVVGMDITDIRYQPFEMKNENGEIEGFDVDFAQMMADELGVSLEIVETSWDEIIPSLINGKFDLIISGMSITTERNKAINFSTPYYLSGKCILISLENGGRIYSYHDLNRSGITITTSIYGDIVLDRYIPDATIVRYDSDREAVLEVVEGRADAYIADKARVRVFYRKYHDKTLTILSPFTYEPIAVGMRKGDPDLLNWVDNFIEIIKGDGRLAELEQRWMIDYEFSDEDN